MGHDHKTGQDKEHKTDQGIRAGTTVDALSQLDTLVQLGVCPDPGGGFGGGRITAGNASQICDGAAAVLVVNEAGLAKLGVEPIAQIKALALAANDPVLMLSAPIPATQVGAMFEELLIFSACTNITNFEIACLYMIYRKQAALHRAGLSIDDIDMAEVNEAFACVPMAWQKELGFDPSKMNIHGGAIALGHPLGGTGAKLMTTLVHELKRDEKKRYGLLAICEGGGTANATIVERC